MYYISWAHILFPDHLFQEICVFTGDIFEFDNAYYNYLAYSFQYNIHLIDIPTDLSYLLDDLKWKLVILS